MPREKLIDTAKRIYRSYGFAPIDTPALEKSEILAGQGSDETDKQMFRFTDAGGRDVGMRFDLTVPSCTVRRTTHWSAGDSVQAVSHCNSFGGVKNRNVVGIVNSCNVISTRSERRPSYRTLKQHWSFLI